MQIRRRELSAPRLDLTPLIDVLFQLLVFLLMTSTFVNLGIIPVSLPSSNTSDPTREAPSVILKRDGTLELEKRVVSPDRLASELKSRLSVVADKSVSVIADKDVPLKRLVSTMDAIRSAGGEGVLVITQE